jgi:hypothetical protein
MEDASSPWVAVSLFLSVASIVLAGIAYWRSGAQSELATVRTSQHLVLDELRRKLRKRVEGSLLRVTRNERRLAELRMDPASVVHEAIDALARELGQIKHESEIALVELDDEITRGAEAAQESLARRIHYVESSVRVLTARSEIRGAERLADRGMFAEAEDQLQDAAANMREAKMRLDDEGSDEPAFAPLLEMLDEAIRSVRARAADHPRHIESVLSASDSLLASLRSHEHLDASRHPLHRSADAAP